MNTHGGYYSNSMMIHVIIHTSGGVSRVQTVAS